MSYIDVRLYHDTAYRLKDNYVISRYEKFGAEIILCKSEKLVFCTKNDLNALKETVHTRLEVSHANITDKLLLLNLKLLRNNSLVTTSYLS